MLSQEESNDLLILGIYRIMNNPETVELKLVLQYYTK